MKAAPIRRLNQFSSAFRRMILQTVNIAYILCSIIIILIIELLENRRTGPKGAGERAETGVKRGTGT